MSITCTVCEEEIQEVEKNIKEPKILVLKLKSKKIKTVKWDTDIIDNEFLNKKKSKCCCVYCKKNPFSPKTSK